MSILNAIGSHGTGIEKSGTGIEKSGTGIEKSGTGIEKSGTGIEKSGTGLSRLTLAAIISAALYVPTALAADRAPGAEELLVSVSDNNISVSWHASNDLMVGQAVLENGSALIPIYSSRAQLGLDQVSLDITGGGTGKEITGGGTG